MGQIVRRKGKLCKEMKKMAKDRDKFRRLLYTPDALKGTKG